MAVADAVVGLSASVANNAYMDMQPGVGAEWVVHNIFSSGACELYWYDGTTLILIDSGGVSTTTGMSWAGYVFEATSAKYLRLKNVSGSTLNMGYSGRVTK